MLGIYIILRNIFHGTCHNRLYILILIIIKFEIRFSNCCIFIQFIISIFLYLFFKISWLFLILFYFSKLRLILKGIFLIIYLLIIELCIISLRFLWLKSIYVWLILDFKIFYILFLNFSNLFVLIITIFAFILSISIYLT